MKTTIQPWGKSLAVRPSKEPAQETAFGEADGPAGRADDGRIVIERPKPKHHRLEDLLAEVTKANRHDAAEFGAPAPREAW